MRTGFFLHLRAHKLPVSARELLTLLEALEARVVSLSLDEFYTLSRACFVKDEQHVDRFDLALGTYFKSIDTIFDIRAEIRKPGFAGRRALLHRGKTGSSSKRWAGSTSSWRL